MQIARPTVPTAATPIFVNRVQRSGSAIAAARPSTRKPSTDRPTTDHRWAMGGRSGTRTSRSSARLEHQVATQQQHDADAERGEQRMDAVLLAGDILEQERDEQPSGWDRGRM